MPIQRQTINIGSVLGTLALEPSETSDIPLAPGFSEGESVMKKRKKGEEETEVTREQQALIQTEPSVTKSPSKKGKGKDSRAPQKATGHVSHKRKHQKELPAPWRCEFYVDGRPVNEDDSDMKAWKGSNSTQMIENLKRDSVVAVQGIFEAGYRLMETERLLNESLIKNDRLREVEKNASTRIQEVESQHKTAEEGLQTAECQLVEISAKAWEYRPFNSGTLENLEEVNVEGLKDSEAVEDPMDPEAVEVLGHQERVQTKEVQDVEKGISDKEDNVNVDG
uniref:Uncharacterized protein n=1 Tax=Fagus sylvatica TaxID=28930 RepID=A0A2N9EGP6_FAGSY